MKREFSRLSSRKRLRGLALIELMIALVLGLVIIGAVTGVLLSNTQSFRTTKSLSQIQDSARLGFEIMARDIRQAGSIPCGNDVAVTNILTAAQTTPPWHLDWEAGSDGQLIGYAGDATLAGLTNRINGTEALTVLYSDVGGSAVDSFHAGNHAYTLNDAGDLQSGDIVFVCDAAKATLFQANVANDTLTAANNANVHTQPGVYDRNSVIGRLKSRAWYIGNNGRDEEGGRSLYLAELTVGATGSPELQLIEIAAGVTDVEFLYRLNDTSDFKTVAQVGSQWALVNAVQISFSLLGQDTNVTVDAATNAGRLSRSFSSIVALRNRIL